MNTLLAGLILLVTLLLLFIRPKNVREAWWALLGGGLTLMLGLVSLNQVTQILFETQDALILLVGMMSLSAVAEKAGFFDWAAFLAVRAGAGRVFLLYGFVFLVGTLVTATLSLDATAIVLTPIVYGMVVRLRLSAVPFMFACIYTANTASLFLPISNLTNLLAYDTFNLGFIRFGLVMLIPAALAVLANFLIFSWLFRNDLRGSYNDKSPYFVPNSPGFFRVATAGVAGTLVAFFVAPLFGVPIGLVALVLGMIVVLVVRLRGWMTLREVASLVSWEIIALIVGLFVVVRGVENAGLTALTERIFTIAAPGNSLFQILGVAIGSAIGSNLINNVPMLVLALSTTKSLVYDQTLKITGIYAIILGTNLGPNLTTVGSLATLIWLSITRSKGLEITAKDYLKIGIVSTPVIILFAAVGLWISVQIFGV